MGKLTWNYRVVRWSYPDGTPKIGIREVYYRDGNPVAVSFDPPDLATEDLYGPNAAGWEMDGFRDLQAEVSYYARALEKPILDIYPDILQPHTHVLAADLTAAEGSANFVEDSDA